MSLYVFETSVPACVYSLVCDWPESTGIRRTRSDLADAWTNVGKTNRTFDACLGAHF